MLAVEVVLAGADPVPTLVFDEVDAGVGGHAAVEIGRRLARLAETHQVVVVTHLAQVAAYADRQLMVDKGAAERGRHPQLGAHPGRRGARRRARPDARRDRGDRDRPGARRGAAGRGGRRQAGQPTADADHQGRHQGLRAWWPPAGAARRLRRRVRECPPDGLRVGPM